MSIFRGTFCTCKDFTTTQQARHVDLACGKAIDFAAIVVKKTAQSSVLGGHVSTEVATALRHHFGIDLSKTRGWGVDTMDRVVHGIVKVFTRIHDEFKNGMTYEYSKHDVRFFLGGVAFTPKVNPKVIHLHARFFKLIPDDRAWALFHEQVHFVSRKPPAGFNLIGDKAYAGHQRRKYSALPTNQAIRNADSYTWFAKELVENPFFHWDEN